MIELSIGTKVRTQGRHGVIVLDSDLSCKDCMLFESFNEKALDICKNFECRGEFREDSTDVYVKEIEKDESKSLSS